MKKKIKNFNKDVLASDYLICIVLTIMFLSLESCNHTNDKKREFIRAEIKLNVDTYKKKRRNDCIQAALDSANKIVDSLIFKQNLVMDSSFQIVKPLKPAKINLKATIDTAAVTPIIKK